MSGKEPLETVCSLISAGLCGGFCTPVTTHCILTKKITRTVINSGLCKALNFRSSRKLWKFALSSCCLLYTSVVKNIYGGSGAVLLPEAQRQAAQLTALGFDRLPVCIAKKQSSFSADPKKLGAPEDFTVTVRQIKVSAGAGFTVALAGNIMTMPGLPSVPAAESIDIDNKGRITGLF